MSFTVLDTDILHNLVGPLNQNTLERMDKNLECFIHSQVSLFIPSSGQCDYAVTPSHTHPAYSFIYYFQSVSDFIVEGRHMFYDLSDGKCLSAMSPGIPHQEIPEEHFQSYIAVVIDTAMFEKTALQYLDSVPVFKGEAFLPHPELLNALRCFILESSETLKNNELLTGLAHVITHLTVRSVLQGAYNASTQLYDRFEVDRAIAFMNSHFSEKITLEDLSACVNLSAGHFSKIFKSVTGESPIDFLNMLRLQKARKMMMSNEKNLTEIALTCGFSSSAYFSACFLEKYSMTPSAFRQNILKSKGSAGY